MSKEQRYVYVLGIVALFVVVDIAIYFAFYAYIEWLSWRITHLVDKTFLLFVTGWFWAVFNGSVFWAWRMVATEAEEPAEREDPTRPREHRPRPPSGGPTERPPPRRDQ